jgi:hypothetical protein
MLRDGQDRVPIPLDPLQGIYLAQGSFVQHVVFAAVNIYLNIWL